MHRAHRHRDFAALGAAITLTLSAPAWGWSDYDPQNTGWNGTSELLRIATEANIELRPTQELDWDTLQRGQSLLVLYPRANLGLADVSAFLDDGGRVAWLDDQGSSESFLQWFQFRRAAVQGGVPRTPDLPELLLARPQGGGHVLTDGVDVLVTNLPMALSHPRLTPLYSFVGTTQGLILVGQIQGGKLLVGGDPSVVINTMMRFPGNRRFGRNLLEFLSGGPGGRVTVVWGDVHVRGAYQGRGRARSRERVAVNTINESLAALSGVFAAPAWLRPVAALMAIIAAGVMAALTWGRRPNARYGPQAPVGAAAGVTERVALFASDKANLLFPALMARKVLEARLLRAAGMRPPVDLRAVLQRVELRLPAAMRADVQAVLVELDALGSRAEDDASQRLQGRQFLSLWRRIDAILAALDGAPDGPSPPSR